jgi:hypothetical protein
MALQMRFFAAIQAHRWRRHWRPAALALVCLAAVWCYAPALHAYFALDDFTLLALARLLREPLTVFDHDHFPGSLFFRPLGIFLWWLTTQWFDNAPRGHYAANLALHLGCVVALYALLQRLRRGAPLNVLWTAVYAVHPLAIGTALWLSDRFDLIATGFSLAALNFALRYRQQPRGTNLLLMLACLLAAFAGKEIAIVAAAAACALLALPDGAARTSSRQRWSSVAAIAALTAGWLAYRHALMTNPQDLLLRGGALVSTFSRGVGLWLRVGFEYLVLDPRQHAWMTVVLATGTALLAATVIVVRCSDGWRPRDLGLAAALLILIFLPGPTQAPVVAVSANDLAETTFWFDLIDQSRLYHLSLAGLIIVLMLLTTPHVDADAAGWVRTQRAVVAALAMVLAAWAVASHNISHDYAQHTRAQIRPLQAAHAAIAQFALPPRHCQIYLLATASIWGFDGLADPIIKASSPAREKLEHCLIMTERTSWGNFVRSGSIQPEDYHPQRPLTYRGRPVPWLILDGFEAAYLDLDADIDARTLTEAVFLEYRDGTFVDVSAAVRDGTRPVHFFNARPDRN